MFAPQSQKQREGKEEDERLETCTKTHSDRRFQYKKDMVQKNIAQNTVPLDKGEKEGSEVTQEAQQEMGGGEEEKEET